MRKVLMIAAVLAFAASAPSYAQKLDKNGRCHAADGKFAKAEVCAKGGAGAPAEYKLDAKGKCRDAKGKFAPTAKCSK